ncbi:MULTISPECIES: hypothetical protein [Calothrix]|uniref:Uncharacterized protein n=2 Tax=Calothrix TaxID=1186 RepID=A0ABR8AHG6_9CYAN|nr:MULTISPECIES: hypothetical protein [Calothrix]MBD2199394.1 hypothetical protein [Calothrix parietina FACHB-288]MBD2228066.1 hypothetical protein [Calothrix anomala FACHB-343]
MLEYLSISKRQPEFPDYLDFQKLREIGIKHLQALSGKLWTDYNLHDPGVTILEVLCYAVTDLGYRNNLDIQDLLALPPNSQENNFFTADEILSCNPVTELDIRKRLIDIPGVRNAWLKKVTNYEPAIYINSDRSLLQSTPPDGEAPETAPRLHPRGLYTVYIDLDVGYRRNACGQLYLSWADTLEEVKKVLCQYRNLCEDIQDVIVLGDEEIAICCDIELKNDADAEDVLVDIYTRLEAFISPNLQFYTLQQLLDKGKSIDEIFAGRATVTNDESYQSHGFIDTDELANLTQPTIIYTSDIYQEILKVPGVAAIKHLSITNYINGLPQSQHPWYLHLTEGYSPVLGMEQSNITLFKGVLPITADVNEVKRRYYEQQTAYIKNLRENYELNLPVPKGSYYNLADHYSIQHDFPLNYGISEDGLPETVKASRKAQALQLKGYLVFFDQLLANYLSQLAHVRDLFSWEMDKNHQGIRDTNQSSLTRKTYFIQALDFPNRPAILDDHYLQSLEEELDTEAYRERRNQFLDHLLGRFAESFSDYVLLNYQMTQKHSDREQHDIELIYDKTNFLKDYPALSRDRFRAFNYCNLREVWNTENVSGFKKRVSRLLGIDDVRRRDLCHYRVVNTARFIFSVKCGSQQVLTSYEIYPTQAQAQADLEKFLLVALHEDFYQRLTCQGLTDYGYAVIDNQGKVLAEKCDRLLTPEAREIDLQSWFSNIQLNHNQFKFVVEKFPDREEYLFKLQRNSDNQIILQSDKHYTTKIEAWKSAAQFAEHLRYLNRYVNLPQNSQGYSLGITDKAGKVVAISPSQTDTFATFKMLNLLDEFLEIEALTATNSGYRFRLNWQGITLLQGTELLGNENTARDRFYRELLGILDSTAILPTQTPDGFSFKVLSKPGDSNTEVAIHPHNYTTATERDAAINRLFLFVRTARLTAQTNNFSSTYLVHIEDENGQKLLQSKKEHIDESAAWKTVNQLLEIIQKPGNFRLINSENGPYGWEIIYENKKDHKKEILANQYYTSKVERDKAITEIQNSVNDEGFHLLEHILLLPQTNVSVSISEKSPTDTDKFLPIFINADDGTNSEAEPWRLTQQDPYSFWISIILPYWPERFRDMNFRTFVERTLRLEAPAHIALKIAWLNLEQMRQFEDYYRNWLQELAQNGRNLTLAHSNLVKLLPNLRSIYPEGKLYDSQQTTSCEAQPIILNQTVLGSTND